MGAMGELKIFEKAEFGRVRVVEHGGEPWFVAKDVAVCLGYDNPANAVNMHCKKTNKITLSPDSGGREITANQPPLNINIIPESDVYRLVMRSHLPDAERFQDWVVEEVLPSIRRHGMYATDSVIDQILNNPEFGIQLLTTLKEEREKRLKAEQRIAILSHVNKTYTATEIAKELGFRSAIALNRELCDRHVQFKQNGTFVLYADYADLGYEEIKQEALDSGRVVYHRRWTQAGREWLLAMFNANFRDA